MKPSSLLCAALAALPLTFAAPRPDRKTPAVFFTGDSTTAPDGGWGDGFLTYFKRRAWGINFAKSGATVPSFIGEGHWDNMTEHVLEYRDEFDIYVTIQFGHNDQKEQYNISLDQFQASLEDLVGRVREAKATPVLISSLTRRAFDAPNEIHDNLVDQRLRAMAAAENTGATFLDLNQASIDYCEAIGEEESQEFNLSGDDRTHLNWKGAIVFSRMVADLWKEQWPQLGGWITRNETVSEAIENGTPV